MRINDNSSESHFGTTGDMNRKANTFSLEGGGLKSRIFGRNIALKYSPPIGDTSDGDALQLEIEGDSTVALELPIGQFNAAFQAITNAGPSRITVIDPDSKAQLDSRDQEVIREMHRYFG